jgi:hypothetical protein
VTRIRYEAANFPSYLGPASGTQVCTFAEIAWAAATVGHTPFSAPIPLSDLGFEMTWRIAMVRANLTPGHDLRRSAAYNRLDPSEKSAVSFFLGQVQAKLFAQRIFAVGVFVHLDRVLELRGAPRARTRPDFIGYDASGALALAVEAKGRSRGWTQELVTGAKQQARSLPSIIGAAPVRYAHIAYFDSDEWCARLDDPPRARGAERDLAAEDVGQAYYLTLARAFISLKEQEDPDRAPQLEREFPSDYRWARLDQARCYLGLTHFALEQGGVAWPNLGLYEGAADDTAERSDQRLTQAQDPRLFFAGADGVAVLLDESWLAWPTEARSSIFRH